MRSILIAASVALMLTGCNQNSGFTSDQDAAYARVFSENLQKSCIYSATSGADSLSIEVATEMCRCASDNIIASHPVSRLREFDRNPQAHQPTLNPYFERCATQVVNSNQARTAPANSDDSIWKEYLQSVAINNMGTITSSPFLYYLPPESDPDFEAKYVRQVESATDAVSRGIKPGNMLAFGSSSSARMADMINVAFNEAQADSMNGVRLVFIGDAVDNARVQKAVRPTGVDYIFVESVNPTIE